MHCISITWRGKAYKHFAYQYQRRRIYDLVDFDDLINRIIPKYYIQGHKIRDLKHPGLEGQRWRIYIPLGCKRLVVIIEKTKNCILPITIWSETSP